jgi:RimJ/RimL family protein N-acetyltransferase
MEALGAGLEQSVRDFFETGAPIQFETEKLILRSICSSDLENYKALWSHEKTMKLYGGNEARIKEVGVEPWAQEQKEKIEKFANRLIKRWEAKDPFSAFAVFKKEGNQFIGHVNVGYGDEIGEAEAAWIIHADYQRQGYGTEAVTAVFKQVLPALIKAHEEKYGKPLEVNGHPFQYVTATARIDNEPSLKIMHKLGMEYMGEKIAYGALRKQFKLTTEQLKA